MSPIRSVASKAVTTPKTAATAAPTLARPPPVRTGWELEAPWKALNMVEAAGRNGPGSLKENAVPGWGTNQPAVNTNFRDNVAPDLKAFINGGKSSLTPYEATQINFGLGGGGTWAVTDREKASGLTRGDRVQLAVTHPDGTSETKSGIVVNDGGVLTVDKSGRFAVVSPQYDNGTQGRDKVVIAKITAGALNDGTLEARGG